MSSETGYVLHSFAERNQESQPLMNATEQEHIRQTVLLLLTIRQGERLLAPNFGNSMYQFCFAPNTRSLHKEIQSHLMNVISEQEPRISDVEVEVQSVQHEPTKVMVSVRYRQRSDQTRQSVTSYLNLQGASNGSSL